MLQGIYDEGNAKQLVDSCAYRILKQIEENVKTPKYLHTVTNVGYKLTPFSE